MARGAKRLLAGALTLLIGSGPIMFGAAHVHVHRHLEHAAVHALDAHVEHSAAPAIEHAASAEHQHVVLVARPTQGQQFDVSDWALVELPAFVLATVVVRIPPTDESMRWFVARQHGPPPPARAPPSA